jgi:TolA-binding protein
MEAYNEDVVRVEAETEAARTRVATLGATLAALNRQAEQLQAQIDEVNEEINEITGGCGDEDYGAGQDLEEYAAQENMEVDAVEQPPLAAPASVRPAAASSTESPPPSTVPVQEPLNPVNFFVFLLNECLHGVLICSNYSLAILYDFSIWLAWAYSSVRPV